MGCNANFSKACVTRDVSTSTLIHYLKQLAGKPEEEKQRLLDAFAREIEATCPLMEREVSTGSLR